MEARPPDRSCDHREDYKLYQNHSQAGGEKGEGIKTYPLFPPAV